MLSQETIYVAWQPVAWRRAQLNYARRTLYTAPLQRRACAELRGALREEWTMRGLDVLPLGVPVQVRTVTVLRRPAHHLGPDGLLRASAPTHHTEFPDVDNLAKLQLDAMKGAIFHDDRQVSHIDSMKVWTQPGETPGVWVEVSWLTAADDPEVIDLTGTDDEGEPVADGVVEVIDLTDD